ncbi:hypothetical protein EZV73_03030 [Acidaminobacter sp. JC074]|uniref:hypothetical protein n=1 Tax=Acidaminobacter sp. JC074 TaxID=2530199 RepID=UPI001F0E4AEC|nr:hypothetical protein [Acidaminobacter sp. JC074]MCH4886522.1 hypothetical protein [Acidaminobacter sp. JC074]
MKKQLEELIHILLGDLSESIYSDTEKIDAYANKINGLLDIRKGSKDQLLTTHISETVIAPLAFWGTGSNEKTSFVHIGMSPLYNKNIHLQKQEAGDKWSSYFNYYTSGHDLLDDKNIIKLLYVLNEEHEQGKITIEDIQRKLLLSKDDLLKHFSEDGLMFAYLMPFHSHAFDTNLNGIEYLMEEIPSYKKYIQRLMTHIKYNLTEDGLIFCDGYSESKIVRSLLEKKGGEVTLENKFFTLMKWEAKTALLLNDPLNSRHGLRSDMEIDQVIGKIKGDVPILDDFCKDLLEKRTDEDYKSRGQRIQGKKLKKIAVKHIRKTGE